MKKHFTKLLFVILLFNNGSLLGMVVAAEAAAEKLLSAAATNKTDAIDESIDEIFSKAKDQAIQFLNHKNPQGLTFIQLAAQNGYTRIIHHTVQILRKHKFTRILGLINHRTDEAIRKYPLHLAAQNGHTETTKALIKIIRRFANPERVFWSLNVKQNQASIVHCIWLPKRATKKSLNV